MSLPGSAASPEQEIERLRALLHIAERRRVREVALATTIERERLALIVADAESCHICGGALLPPQIPPHCYDCSCTDECDHPDVEGLDMANLIRNSAEEVLAIGECNTCKGNKVTMGKVRKAGRRFNEQLPCPNCKDRNGVSRGVVFVLERKEPT